MRPPKKMTNKDHIFLTEVVQMSIPKDPAILLSFVNTQLRDNYPSLDEMCASLNINKDDIVNSLKKLDYTYNSTHNRFM